MSHEILTCEICGLKGPKEKWYYEPKYVFGKEINARIGDIGQVGHREKIIYFKHKYGFHHVGVACCDVCHTIVRPLKSTQSIFDSREKFHEYVDKRVKFRAMAKNTKSNDSVGIVYTHFNRIFTKGLIIKIPGSDDPISKDDIWKHSKFKYVMITNVYTKKNIPNWAKDTGYSVNKLFESDMGVDFDYYVEVKPYEIDKMYTIPL